MDISTSNILTADIAQILAYHLVKDSQACDTKSRNELFKNLQNLSSVSKGARSVKNLVFGIDLRAEQFNRHMISRFMQCITLHTSSHCLLWGNSQDRKCYLAMAYCGTPFALGMLETFLSSQELACIRYQFDAHKVITSRIKYANPSYSSDVTYAYDACYEEYEPLHEALKKFPLSTRLFCKNILESRGFRLA